MTYNKCIKVIENKHKILSAHDWEDFAIKIKDDLDTFLLAGRLTKEQYDELMVILNNYNS